MRFAGRLAPSSSPLARRPLSWNLLAVLHLRPSRLAIIISHWEFGPALKRYRTHRRTSNFSQMVPIVGSRFSDRAHYNEFVESGAKSWALMRRRLVLEMKGIQNRTAQRPKEKGPSLEDGNAPTPLDHAGASLLFLGLPSLFAPFLWVVFVVIYSSLPFILPLHLSVIHAYPQVYVPSVILSGAL